MNATVLVVGRAGTFIEGDLMNQAFSCRRAGDPPRLVANATKAREVLGWVPEYEELGPIVETAWRYMDRG